MNKTELKNLETDNYELVWGTLQGAGTFIIIDKNTDKSTLRNTGTDAVNDYKHLQKLFNKSMPLFDNYIKRTQNFS